MIRYIILSFLFLGCGDIDFRDKKSKNDFCVSNLDHVQCKKITPFYLLYGDTLLRSFGSGSSVCDNVDYVNTHSCKFYYYSKEYKDDLKKYSLDCENDFKSYDCQIIRDYLIDIKKLIKK